MRPKMRETLKLKKRGVFMDEAISKTGKCNECKIEKY